MRVPLLLICNSIIEPGVNPVLGGQKDVPATVMEVLGGSWINNTLGRSLLSVQDGHAFFIQGKNFGFIEDGVFLLRTRNIASNLYNYSNLMALPDESIVKEKLINKSLSYLKVTHYLIAKRQVTLPASIPVAPLKKAQE